MHIEIFYRLFIKSKFKNHKVIEPYTKFYNQISKHGYLEYVLLKNLIIKL